MNAMICDLTHHEVDKIAVLSKKKAKKNKGETVIFVIKKHNYAKRPKMCAD